MITIAKFLKDWETKNAKNVAKTGSFSMMALSLAACGGGGGGGGGVSTLTILWLVRIRWLCLWSQV